MKYFNFKIETRATNLAANGGTCNLCGFQSRFLKHCPYCFKKDVLNEDYAIVLSISLKNNITTVQAIGVHNYDLFEVIIRDRMTIRERDKIYIGDQKPDVVRFIIKKLEYNNLTDNAKHNFLRTVSNPENYLYHIIPRYYKNFKILKTYNRNGKKTIITNVRIYDNIRRQLNNIYPNVIVRSSIGLVRWQGIVRGRDHPHWGRGK